jgi:hypothetical protein
MKIIIKDRKMNLKVKTDNIALAQTVLGFIRSQVNSTSAKTAFRVGMLAGNLMSDLKSHIDSQKPNEEKKDDSGQPLLKHGNKAGRPKGVKNKHRKFARVEWTDEEILFLNDAKHKKAVHVLSAPELKRHTKAAILSKRFAIKHKIRNNLSKHQLAIID